MYGEIEPAVDPLVNKCGQARRMTLTETLLSERGRLQARLAEIDAALVALEASPEVKAVLDLLQKTRCI